MLLLTLLMCWYMIGLSCFVWVIAYPQFDRVNAEISEELAAQRDAYDDYLASFEAEEALR